MRLAKLHDWNVTPAEAREIQEKLRAKWEGQDRMGDIRTVAGLDAAFVLSGSQALKKRSRWTALREANRAIGGVVVFRFPEMVEIARASAVLPLRFPYVPGLLSFREIPVLLAALAKLTRMPDLLFCDAQGYAHPRRMGLATHLGILLDRPTIGCAKSILIGSHGDLAEKAGSWTALTDDKAGGERIGAAVRTRDGFAGASSVARVRDSPDSGRERRRADTAANAGSGSLRERSEAQGHKEFIRMAAICAVASEK